MLANFHTCVILLSLSAALYMFVRYFSSSLPMCLRCIMLILFCPIVVVLVAVWN